MGSVESLRVSAVLEQLSNGDQRSIMLDCPGNTEAHDSIKKARREDDPRFSQGVWQTPLKKADWGAVEQLCLQHLQTASTAIDAHVLGWLAESWIAQNGLTGVLDGLLLFQAILSGGTAPGADEDAWDMTTRWMDRLWADRLVQTSFLPGVVHVSLSQWLSSAQLENALGAASEKEKTAIQAQLLKQKSTRQLREMIQGHQSILQDTLEKCEVPLQALRVSGDLTTLTAYLQTLKEIVSSLTKVTTSTDSPASVEAPAEHPDQSLTTRTLPEIYGQLRTQADALAQLEPQGIVHLFLKKLLLYKGCSQIEFFQLLSERPEDISVFLRFLGVQSTQKEHP